MNHIFYPNLNLFIYQLRNGLGDQEEDIQQNQQTFWNNLPDNLPQLSLEQESKATHIDYLELLPLTPHNKSVHWFHTTADNYQIKGYYYPVRLNDSYGLLLNSYIDDVDYYHLISCFKTLKHLAESKQGNLGKTWMISGCLPADDTQPKTLAESAYQALMSEEWQNPQQGRFLGAPIFEVWQPPQRWESLEENSYVLVILYPNQSVEKAAAKYYEDWLQLFCYRNKILWAYSQTRQLRKRLQASFASIFGIAKKLKQLSLKELQENLEINIEALSQYASDLNYLEIQLHTIQVNQQNYQEQLDCLIEEASKEGETNLYFLSRFSQIVKQKYQVQIQEDYASLSPGLRVLEDVINTIRGIVEVKKAESDRNLNTTIAVAGIGLATSQIASAVILAQPPANADKTPLAFRTEAFVWSLGIGAIAMLITWVIIRLRR